MSSVELASARVLLTGATGGLGQATARELVTHGADLVLTGRRAETVSELAADLGAAVIADDLSNPEDLSRLLTQAGRTLQRYIDSERLGADLGRRFHHAD
ncbi:SDR family NAD(P)-dependent oxidoreductase [Nocardia beijingensis]|uniref:SDR family NAD(P)-dependent oxidoreductase n=1 Tax=Nocardia beijingensis TaxID=95162 RepID=UPI00340ECC26